MLLLGQDSHAAGGVLLQEGGVLLTQIVLGLAGPAAAPPGPGGWLCRPGHPSAVAGLLCHLCTPAGLLTSQQTQPNRMYAGKSSSIVG